jgi:PKHD-type hydroxylase
MTNQMLSIWPANLNDQFIDAIINTGNKLPIAQTAIGFGGDVDSVDSVRRSEIRWVNTFDESHKFIVDTLWNFATDANRDHYGFDLNYLRDIQYTTYRAEDNAKYDWHQDTFWLNPTANHRKISMVIQLTDPSDYEGGEFQIDPEFGILDQSVIKQRGTVLAFPSFLRHRVTPVTAGVRRSLVCWVEGPKFR